MSLADKAYTGLKLEIDGHTAVVTLSHPPANTWTRDSLVALRDLVRDLDAQREVYALVITGEGRYDGQTGTGKVASVVGELAREAGAVFAVAAGRFDEQPADGSIAVTLPETDDVREQLIQAGAEIAVAYLNTSTVQG